MAHWQGSKEGNVLINNALNTFYTWLYSVRHMVKDHSDSERRNSLLPHGLSFQISSEGSFICIIPDRIAHTMAFVTPVAGHWLEREIAQWVHHEGSIRHPITPWANTLTTELHLAPVRDQSQTAHTLVIQYYCSCFACFCLRMFQYVNCIHILNCIPQGAICSVRYCIAICYTNLSDCH